MRSALLPGLVAFAAGAALLESSAWATVAPDSITVVRPDMAAISPVTSPQGPGDDPAQAEGEWWRRLGDSTLTRLIDEALGGNLDVRAAQARVRAARAARARAVLDLTPEGVVGGSYTRRRFSSANFPGASGTLPDEDVWDAGFDAAWELDVFGRIRHNVRAQGALLAASKEDLRGVQVTLIAELARAYFELRGAQEQLDVARRNAENQRHTLELTKERLDAGKGTAFDTERATTQLNVTLATIPAREADVAAAQYRIGVLVGRSPVALAKELGPAEGRPPLPDSVEVGNADSASRGRPDVAAAERIAAAQSALLSSARAEYLPRFAVGGSVGYTASGFNALGDAGTFRYAVGPVITWPMLNLGRIHSEVNVARAQQEAAQAQYRQTVLAAIGEIESALSRYYASRSRLERLEEASAASERAAELARMRFAEGITDFLQVLDAERTQLESQNLLAQVRTEAATAYAGLYKALGGQ